MTTEVVHARAKALTDGNPRLDYRAAVKQVLTDDLAFKAAYAGVQ